MGFFDTVIEDVEDLTKDISATIGMTEEGHETESAEPTEEQEPPKAYKPTLLDKDDIPPEWSRGVLYSGEEASETAFELVDGENIERLVRFFRGSEIKCDGRKQNDKDQDSKDASLGVHFSFNLPVSEGFTAGAKTDYNNTKHTAKCIENNSRSSLIVIMHGEMRFKTSQIKPTDEFLKDIKDALKTAKTDKFATYDALQRLQHLIELMVCYTGGRATSTAEETLETDEQTKANSKEGGANLVVSGIGPSADTSKRNQIEVIRKAELDKSKLIAYGGDGTVLMTEGVKKWAKTIPKNLKVVHRENFKPMYDLLDKKTRQDVEDIYEFKEHKDHIRYNAKLRMKHADYGRYIYIDENRILRDNRSYRGKVLYAYDKPGSHGNPPPVMFKQIPTAGERRSKYAQFGHRVTIELLYKDKPEPIQMSQLPFDHIRLLKKVTKSLVGKKAQHKYVDASVYQSTEGENTSKKEWVISTAKGCHEKDDLVKMEGEVSLKSYIIDRPNVGFYLCLAKHGTKPEKIVSVKEKADGRFVVGKLCPTPMDKELQVIWKFDDKLEANYS
ncbi:hypothetical protein DFQ30_008853 [Apophysomyces sp. BC1015]|nr:hypothetical protein DFQ30_008853 [Apophysomyces sp. BC1015]KAG0173731.1 hypothetical protein DFQ29_007779 [Apophysomyces sp. BC1021]